MADPTPAISLLEQISTSGFRASIITTYSCYLPFYEQVVLRRLVAAGCTHNVVFVDAGRLGDALGVDEQRPRLAGTAYTLIPVPRSGAFHPKLLLQIGPTKGSLCVGSHNLTLSGFGLNDELTAVFRAEPPDARAGAAAFHVARDFVRTLLPADLPEVGEALEAVFDGAPWLNGPAPAREPRRQLLASTGDGTSLWSLVRRSIPAAPTRALVISPFFDLSLAFLRRLMSDVRPASLTVAIDPAMAVIPPDAPARMPGIRFVNIAGRSLVPQRREGTHPYVHAKALWFDAPGGEVLVTGSANASGPAFLDDAPRRNSEAVVVDASPGVAEALGLLSFFDAPEVSPADWAQVLDQSTLERDSEESSGVALMATPSDDGFMLSGPLPEDVTLMAVDRDGTDLGAVAVLPGTQPARVTAAPEVRDLAAFLSGRRGGDTRVSVTVIVHRPHEIARHSETDSRRTLTQALGALEDDPSQLEALLRVTAKVIFEVQDNVAAGPMDTPLLARPAVASAAPAQLATLAIEAQGRRAARQRRLARGDLAYLLDVLIRRLGEGMPPPPPPAVDDEQVGADEERGGVLGREVSATIDLAAIAKICRAKTRKLVKRMCTSLDKATAPGQAQRAIVQLTAVAGVLRALALVERRPEWRRSGHELVDADALLGLVRDAAHALVAQGEGLIVRARREAGDGFEELSSSLGLLAALTYLCGVDVTTGPPPGAFLEPPPDPSEYWHNVQVFSTLAPALALDTDAQAILALSLERLVVEGRWLADHLSIAEALADLETAPPAAASPGITPQRGDWVIVPPKFSPRVRVVLQVVPANGGPQMVVADPDDPSGKRVFTTARAHIVPRTSLIPQSPAARPVSEPSAPRVRWE